jgi:TonB family protein
MKLGLPNRRIFSAGVQAVKHLAIALILLPVAALAQNAPSTEYTTPPRHLNPLGCMPTVRGPNFNLRPAETVVSFKVEADGTVKDVVITQASGASDTDQAVVECARHFQYLPAQKDGHPVEVDWGFVVKWNAPRS